MRRLPVINYAGQTTQRNSLAVVVGVTTKCYNHTLYSPTYLPLSYSISLDVTQHSLSLAGNSKLQNEEFSFGGELVTGGKKPTSFPVSVSCLSALD